MENTGFINFDCNLSNLFWTYYLALFTFLCIYLTRFSFTPSIKLNATFSTGAYAKLLFQKSLHVRHIVTLEKPVILTPLLSWKTKATNEPKTGNKLAYSAIPT